MKKNIIKQFVMNVSLFLVNLLTLFAFGCSENEVNPKPEPPIENFDFALLTDTVWRLTGFVDNSGEIRIPEPEGNHRYWLRFNADTTFSGKTSVNPFSGKIALDVDRSAIRFSDLDITEFPDTIDSNLYLERLLTANSYSVKESELKLYYNGQKDYLLFEPRGEITYPIEVAMANSEIFDWYLRDDSVYRIDSKGEFLQLLPAKYFQSYPEESLQLFSEAYDFNKYSLILVHPADCNGYSKVKKSLLQQISINEYQWYLDIHPSTALHTAHLVVPALVSKLPEKTTIELHIVSYPVEIETTDFALPSDCSLQNQHLDSVYVIRSMEELAPFITCSTNNVSIDFEKYSLLYVQGVATNGIRSFTKTLRQRADQYFLYLNRELNMGTEAESWQILIQTPKIAENQSVTLYSLKSPSLK
jgi:heat shock protein HslJ